MRCVCDILKAVLHFARDKWGILFFVRAILGFVYKVLKQKKMCVSSWKNCNSWESDRKQRSVETRFKPDLNSFTTWFQIHDKTHPHLKTFIITNAWKSCRVCVVASLILHTVYNERTHLEKTSPSITNPKTAANEKPEQHISQIFREKHL